MSSREKLTPSPPILCLCLVILEDKKTPRIEDKWNYLIYGYFLASAEPRWHFRLNIAIAIRSWPWAACAKSGCEEQQVMLAGVSHGEYWLTGNKNKCQMWNVKCEMQKLVKARGKDSLYGVGVDVVV